MAIPDIYEILIALPQTGTQIFGKYIVMRFHSAESPGVLDSADFLLQLSTEDCTMFATEK